MFLTFDRYLQISWRSVKAILTNWLPTPVYHHPEILCRVVAVTTAITRLFSVTLLPPSASALMLLMVMCCQSQKLLEIQTVLNLVCWHAIDRPTFSIQTEKKCRQKRSRSFNCWFKLFYLLVDDRPPPPSQPGYKVYAHLVNRAPCSRARKLALGVLTVASVGVYVPQCNRDGSFNQIQCHQVTGYCWCVDEKGIETPRTRTRGTPKCDKGKGVHSR